MVLLTGFSETGVDVVGTGGSDDNDVESTDRSVVPIVGSVDVGKGECVDSVEGGVRTVVSFPFVFWVAVKD